MAKKKCWSKKVFRKKGWGTTTQYFGKGKLESEFIDVRPYRGGGDDYGIEIFRTRPSSIRARGSQKEMLKEAEDYMKKHDKC